MPCVEVFGVFGKKSEKTNKQKSNQKKKTNKQKTTTATKSSLVKIEGPTSYKQSISLNVLYF